MESKNISLKDKIIKSAIQKYCHYKLGLIQTLISTKHKLSNLVETNYQLGVFHLNAHNMNDAEFRFRIVLYFEPTHYNALYGLAKCLLAKKKIESAKKKLQRALELKENFLEAQYLLTIINQSGEIHEVPLSVIEEHYDSIAPEFNETFSLKKGYRVAEYISELLINQLDAKKTYDVLDIGCGTGKCGIALAKKQHIKTLMGVDISSKMLIEAQKSLDGKPSHFNTLFHSDYSAFLSKTKQKFDIVIAGSSLHFKKDLAKTLRDIVKVMRPKGHLVFAVEKSFDTSEINLNPDYENFCYNKEYVETSIRKSGLTLIDLGEMPINSSKIILVAICKK